MEDNKELSYSIEAKSIEAFNTIKNKIEKLHPRIHQQVVKAYISISGVTCDIVCKDRSSNPRYVLPSTVSSMVHFDGDLIISTRESITFHIKDVPDKVDFNFHFHELQSKS